MFFVLPCFRFETHRLYSKENNINSSKDISCNLPITEDLPFIPTYTNSKALTQNKVVRGLSVYDLLLFIDDNLYYQILHILIIYSCCLISSCDCDC